MTPADRDRARRCRWVFRDFVRAFWTEVPGAAPLQWNWHMEVLADAMQESAERVFAGLPREDLVINVPPGTSKSSIISILFHCWVWAVDPGRRFLAVSHTDSLAMDLAGKARDVLEGELFGRLFPHVAVRGDRSAKGDYATTAGGDRLTGTVAGKSPTGRHAHFQLVDDPLDPKKALSEVELKAANDFMTQTLPSRKVNKAVDVTVQIMQRLHEEDPSGQALRMAKEEGSVPVRHVCLPAELEPDGRGGWLPGNVSPPGLAARYVDGLLDPVRLPRNVLKQFRLQLGVYAYSGQFLQHPSPPGGGMFQAAWFSRRVKAAPYDARRVRAWDVAATTSELNPGAAFTAGVLMCKDADGRYYVEHVEKGQWEPHERNARIRATAKRDRARYGPAHEPRIYVERQPGSAGKDAWIAVAKILDGFPAHEDPVTGDKATRAEPFTGPLSAGLVSLVEDGTWDCEAYVHEFLLFPLGRLKDQVDATSAAYSKLAQGRTTLGMRCLSFRHRDAKVRHPQLVVCTTAALEALEVDPQHRCLLTTTADPGVPRPPSPKGFVLLDETHVPFADLEPDAYQDKWGEPVPPTGLLPGQLLLDRDGGKAFWAGLLRKREPPADVFVFASPGGRRALTLAMAAADGLRVPREKIHLAGEAPADNKVGGEPPCPHAYAAAKAARGYVVG